VDNDELTELIRF